MRKPHPRCHDGEKLSASCDGGQGHELRSLLAGPATGGEPAVPSPAKPGLLLVVGTSWRARASVENRCGATSSVVIQARQAISSAPHAAAGASPRPDPPSATRDGRLIHAANSAGKSFPLQAVSVLLGASYRNNGHLAEGRKAKRRRGKESLRDSTRRAGKSWRESPCH